MVEAELKVLEGKQQGKVIPLNVRKFLIGREQDCQLRPNSELVSRHHCVFSMDGFTVRLRDLGSTNGTLVNGRRIQGQVVLKDGDQIQVGKLSFQLVVRQRVEAPAPVSTAVPLAETTYEPEPAAELPPEPMIPMSDSAVMRSEDTVVNESETRDRSPAPPNAFDGDTTIMEGQPQQPPPVTYVPPPANYQQYPGYPGGAPYPPQPQYPMAGYPMPPAPYPGQYAPGYPPAPYGYPPQPQYPQPQYQMPPAGYYPPGQPGYPPPQQGYPQPAYQPPPPAQEAAAPAAPEKAAGKTVAELPVYLPPPEETGAKEPPPKPAAEPKKEGEKPTNPSSAAADIIRMHMQRRPT